MSIDTIVQIALALALAVLSLVGATVGFFVQLAVRKLIERLNDFGTFMTNMTEHKARTEERLDTHQNRLDHHQRWLEEQQQNKLNSVCKAGHLGGHQGLAAE